MQTITVGNAVESLVCDFLKSHNLRFICSNYRCRLGEIDLVMFEEHSDTLVFIEVRYRASFHYGGATQSVDWKKQRKLRRAVLHYLQKNATARQRARIDVIGVSAPSEDIGNPFGPITHGVSMHEYRDHQLVWTRNAIEEC